jgi:Mg2+-importing ATPase
LSELFAELDSNRGGLTPEEAVRRLAQFGPNDPASTRAQPAWQRLLRRFSNPFVLLLLGAGAISAAAGDLASLVIIATIILLSVLMDWVGEMRAENAVQALQARAAVQARVVRASQARMVSASALVPGDVVQLGPGSLVPADGRILDATALFVNEALLTGESYPVAKEAAPAAAGDAQDTRSALFAGTAVVAGSGSLLVAATGKDTALGAIGDALAGKASTAFEVELRRFSTMILRITVVLVAIVLSINLWFARGWLESLLFALALAVGLTPALLPMIVTVTLARGALRLVAQQVIVRRLTAIHNLGAADVLCTDKTGTLTEASVRLVRADDAAGRHSARVFELAWLNSYFQSGPANPMDLALRAEAGWDASGWRKLDEVPFDFERRRVTVLLEHAGERWLIVKGAPESVLALSTTIADDEQSKPLLADRRTALGEQFERIGQEGYRALGIAYRKLEPGQERATRADERDLVFAGFAVFMDPPKVGASAAIANLERDGVDLKILTGDHEQVALHLCKELRIPVRTVMTGAQTDALDERALVQLVPGVDVFCRVTPLQKLRILTALKGAGKTVAFLGDGINDAPAIHAADVGISVDNAADVARAAADIVLLQRDLNVLHAGVIEGRRTVINVRKYILLASTSNFGNIMSMVLAGLFLSFLPLLPIQVLLTNLLYDMAQGGLPFDMVDREELSRPLQWDATLVRRFMFIGGPVSTVFDVMTFAVLLLVLQTSEAQFRTGWFIESLVTQLFSVFAIRTRRPLFASRPHPLVTALAVGFALLTVLLPYLPVGPWFHLTPLPLPYFAFLAVALAGFLALMEAVKRLVYAKSNLS